MAAADVLEKRDVRGRRVFTGVEHGEIVVPADLITNDMGFDLYSGVLRKGLFQIEVKGTNLSLRAGNAIGLIPLNDRAAIEVRTRVPVANLARLLSVSGHDPKLLELDRTYGQSPEALTSIQDVLCDGLLTAVDGMRAEGFFKTYFSRRSLGMPSGRIFPYQSALLQARSLMPVAVHSRFMRSTDNAVNHCIASALMLLLASYTGMRERTGIRQRVARLAAASVHFPPVSLSESKHCLTDKYVERPNLLPAGRPYLNRAVTLSALILKNAGPDLYADQGNLLLPTILIEMEDVFEKYVRTFLVSHMAPTFDVLDGNINPPNGAAGYVFQEALSSLGNSKATPDIVVRAGDAFAAILEVKYKPCPGMPSRDDINQAIVYGMAYSCASVVLTYPSLDTGLSISPVGRVGDMTIYKARFPLASHDMTLSEKEFSDELSQLIKGKAQ